MFFYQDSTVLAPRQSTSNADRPAKPGGSQMVRSGDRTGVPALRSVTRVPADSRRSLPAGQPFREISDVMAITPSVTVVLPVLNEAANLPLVFESLPAWIDEVVLVDGRSTDNTIEVARRLRPDVKVVVQGGVGKGDALVAGFAAATGDIIITIDGDGSTDGREIVRFLGTLLAGADFAKGSRFSSSGRSDDITILRRYGNKMLNITVNRMFGTSFSDLCYGYNAFWARHLGKLDLDCPGFEVETLMSIRAARAGLRIQEVPSHERPRMHGSSNLSAVRDGLRILRLILAEKRAVQLSARRRPKPFLAPGHLSRGDAAQVIGQPAQGQPAQGQPAQGQPAQDQPVNGHLGPGDVSIGHFGRVGFAPQGQPGTSLHVATG
jgi:Glycosyl transferase family 2